eukprot:TRINITY_DN12560_c0_g1_i1.p1 TRINITY_DN12560_c0_g1~~TRINITY_DN12560_c0_g1_i1.p1  ORF type:complete len:930 (+),score=250.34 TRINITY_DN12560_c0_g1_i1:145-2934(+)
MDTDVKKSAEISMNEEDGGSSLDEKVQTLRDRAKDINSFLETLTGLQQKLEKKKTTIKDIIQKKIEDNVKELQKWQELLFIIVDESLDEKIEKLNSQATYFRTTQTEIKDVLAASASSPTTNPNNNSSNPDDPAEEDDDQRPKLDDLLALELNLQPDGLSPAETTEMESRIKNDFNMLLAEPKKSLRRTFTYIGGIIRGYLRRGKSNINWIKIMRTLEGREFEEGVNLNEPDPYIGTKMPVVTEQKEFVEDNVSNTWNSMTKLFDNRNNPIVRTEFCQELYKYYDRNPEDVEFYLPQLANLLLNQYNEFQPLRKFILDKCSQSFHFALRVYLHVRAAKDSREPPKKKKITPVSIIKWRVLCNQFMSEIENALGTAAGFGADHHGDSEHHPLKQPLTFMDELVAIANQLSQGTIPASQYASELSKKLQACDTALNASHPLENTFIYIPVVKTIGTFDLHRVIRVPSKEAYPIPTYGRVLYSLVLEVVDCPALPEDKKDKKEKKHKKKKKEISASDPDSETLSSQDSSQDEKKDVRKTPKKLKEQREETTLRLDQSSEDQMSHMSTSREDLALDEEALAKLERKERKKKKKEKKAQEREERERSSSNATEPTRPSTSPNHSFISLPHGHELPVHSSLPIRNLGYHQAYGELWDKQARRIKSESPFGNLPGWRMQPLILKSGEEILQEEFAMQLIIQFQRIFMETGTPVKVLPYRISAISSKAGFIEPIPNSLSLDKLKKQHTNLLNFFIQSFGETSEHTFKMAQLNFVETLAAYSVICYLLQIKDRHNGNMLLDASGHLIHIDFGYLLSKTIHFEKAPFKLTTEFVEVMGGFNSPCYKEYIRLCQRSFLAARKHYKKIMTLVEMTMEGKGKKVLPCLQGGQQTLIDLEKRFHLDWSKEECENFVGRLIEEARGSWRTIVYDAYQLILNNIH